MTLPDGDGPVIVVRAPATRAPERHYVLDQVLGEWLGLRYELRPWAKPLVSLERAGGADGRKITLPDTLFSTPPEDWLTERCLPPRPLRLVDIPAGDAIDPLVRRPPEPLPVLYGDRDGPAAAWTETPTGLALSVDVLGGVFALLTRLEEVLPTRRDARDRFPVEASLADPEDFVERPLADDYVDLLWLAMRILWPDLRRPASTFRLRLTHDIDTPWAALNRPLSAVTRSAAGDLLKRRDPRLAVRRVRALADARHGRVDRDPLNTFDFLMATSERHGLRSTFYFQAGTTTADEDFRYRLSDPPFAGILHHIHERGHEIGLHGSYGSFDSEARIRTEADALRTISRAAGVEQPEWGGRQHYLRFANPQTWRHHEAAGLAHDSTLGFAERPGFRSGTCREHTVFDLRDRRPLNLRERPLIVMDASLFGYMGLDLDEAASHACAIVDTCRRRAGDAVVLYHNDTLAGDRARAHYRDLVAQVARTDTAL